MSKISLLLAVLLVGCASTQKVVPVVPTQRQPEIREMPPHPAAESLPEGFAGPEWSQPLEAGSCPAEAPEGDAKTCPEKAGILVSESKAARIKMYQVRYEELRRYYEADRTTWSAQRMMYEAEVARRDKYIEDNQPTWWDDHKAEFYGIGGMLIGAVITAVVTYAVNAPDAGSN